MFSLLTSVLLAASLTWVGPQRVSTPDSRPALATDPQVAVAADGAALVAYAVDGDTWIAAAPAGGKFGAPRKLLPGQDSPTVAVQPDGTALVTGGTGTAGRGVYAVGAVDGTFGEAKPLPEPGLVTAVVAVPGRFLAAIETETGHRLEFDTHGALLSSSNGGLGGEAGPDGTLAFAFHGPGTAGVTVRRPDGRWTTHRFKAPELDDPQAAVAPDGRIGFVAVRPRLTGEAALYGSVVVTELGPRGFGTLRTAPVEPAKHPTAFAADIAYDAQGRRVVAWIEDPSTNPGAEGEVARGRVWALVGGRRVLLDGGAAHVTLVPIPQGVLAVSDGGAWRTVLINGTAVTRLNGPSGRPYDGAALATSADRTVFVWRDRRDGGVRAAFTQTG